MVFARNTSLEGAGLIRVLKSEVFRPDKELKGFEKTILEVGEIKTVKIDLDRFTFSYFSRK